VRKGPCGSAARPGAVADIRVGTTAGTFGGSADGDVCDVDRLIDHVTADPSLARAFGAPFAVAATGASALIRELTPVVLLTDTAVTEYALRGDGVGSRQAILQRGTAVLVDAAGMPAVRCISGSPVRAPQTLPPDVVIEGEAWDGFDLSRVSRTPPGDRLVDRLVLVDVRTGLPVIRPIGADGRTGILAGSILASAG
jgi:hypothetical protein